jgi:3-hydroxyisobutyrate dehydrogenase-like beta-hydroxyacid dehydrogenase
MAGTMRRTTRTIRRVGMIGLGKMGRPMSRHLLANGFEVIGYDVDPAAARKARTLGVHIAGSPAEVAAASDLVIVVVRFDTEVDDVLFGPDGILEGARPGTIVAIAATVAPATMRALARKARGTKLVFLDAPLCRGEPAAEQGRLQVMVGGDVAAFKACLPAFRTFSDSIHHLGKLGAGQVGKMVNNLILWACIAANVEGLRLGAALGVAEEPLRMALLESSASNWALQTWLQPRPMPWAEKDMNIVLQEADIARLSLPLCGSVKEVIKGIKIERGLPMPGQT